MTYQVLARKWRPRRFSELVGQAHVKQALTNALDSDRLHHAYLFTGTRGVGKTTLARLFAKAINCERGVSSEPCGECRACVEVDAGRFVDLIEVDAASRTKVDDTRDLLDNVQFAATAGRYKVYLIDEVHMFSNHSFNALLKTLEEPPSHVKFLLATTEPKKLPVTILSRCLQFNLSRLTRQALAAHLEKVLASESIAADPVALSLLADAAQGSARDALSLLDQAIAHCGGEVTEAGVASMLGSIRYDEVASLFEALLARDGKALIIRARALVMAGATPEAIFAEMLQVLTRCAVLQFAGESADPIDDGAACMTLASALDPELTQLWYQIALQARRDLELAPDAQSGLEMGLIRLLAFAPDDLAPAAVRKLPSAAASLETAAVPERGAPDLGSETAIRKGVNAPQHADTAKHPDAASSAEIPEGADTPEAMARSVAWAERVAALELDGRVRALAEACAPRVLEPMRVVLEIAEGHAVMARPEVEQALAEALTAQARAVAEASSEPCAVELRIERVTEVAGDTPLMLAQRREAARQRAAEAAAQTDPMVQALVSEFGASIETVRPRGNH